NSEHLEEVGGRSVYQPAWPQQLESRHGRPLRPAPRVLDVDIGGRNPSATDRRLRSLSRVGPDGGRAEGVPVAVFPDAVVDGEAGGVVVPRGVERLLCRRPRLFQQAGQAGHDQEEEIALRLDRLAPDGALDTCDAGLVEVRLGRAGFPHEEIPQISRAIERSSDTSL